MTLFNSDKVWTSYLISLVSAGIATSVCVSLFPIMPNIDQYIRVIIIDKLTKRMVKSNKDVNFTIEEVALSLIVKRRVTLACIDLNGHMNNSKYLYELNFSRRYFFTASGVWDVLKNKNINMIIQAQTIRYRRELKLWQSYRIKTSIKHWSEKEKCFYVESTFLIDGDFIAAIHIAKYKLVSMVKNNENSDFLSPSFVLKSCYLLPIDYIYPYNEENFDLESVIGCWEESNKISSKELFPKKFANN